MRDCTIRAFDGCTCKEGECHSKAVELGRFEKANDMTGVFTAPARWQYGLVFIFAALSMWWAILESAPRHKAMGLATQESGR